MVGHAAHPGHLRVHGSARRGIKQQHDEMLIIQIWLDLKGKNLKIIDISLKIAFFPHESLADQVSSEVLSLERNCASKD